MPGVLTQKDRNWLSPFDVAEDVRISELLCRIRAEADVDEDAEDCQDCRGLAATAGPW